jgi:penicillin-binding protein 1A
MSTNNKTKKKRLTVKSLLIIIGILFLIGAGSTITVFALAAKDLPAWDPQQLSGAKTTFIYDYDNKLAASLHAEENRTEVSLDKIPQDLIDAFISIEDKDFYKHHGVNFKGILRAVVRNVQSGDLTGQGASTITQQLARNAFLTLDKQWERKIKEMILSFKLEAQYSKDEILIMYMNKIPFGAGAYGVQAAANTYFNKDVNQLTLEECALLAGLPQSPNAYNPFKFYDRAKARQQSVLNNMVECGFIKQETADKAFATELQFNNNATTINSKYGFFVDAVIEETLDVLSNLDIFDDPDNAIYRAGLKIYTTMDSDLQSYAENLYTNNGNFPNQSQNGQQIESAMALVDHSNGEIRSIMGGRKYEYKRGFNRATSAYRQPGSSIKPISVYAPAVEDGYMPFYVLDDSPISFKIGSSVWSPENYDKTYRGLITMRTAVRLSINTYAVQMLDQIGIRRSFDFAKSMGLELVDTPGTNDLGLAPLSLGGLTKGATPVQMAAAYAAIGNGGVYVQPHFIRKIVDAQGSEIYSFKPNYSRIMSEETSWLVSSMLQTVVNSGTGTKAKVPGVVTAGKTGTSEEYKDSWFCGFTPGYSVAVWMGYDQEYNMNNVYGGGYPASIFRLMLQKAHEKNNPSQRAKPNDIIQVAVCSKSGILPSDICPENSIISDYCTRDTVPGKTCDVHQEVFICPESGKLAGEYCPQPELRVMVKTKGNSRDSNRIPSESCDIHSHPTVSGLFSNEVYICKDPRHNGKLYQANVPNSRESGGCPDEYLKKIILPPGENLPFCSLEDHRIEKKKPKDIINDIIN